MGKDSEINAGPLMKGLGEFYLYFSLGSHLSEFVILPELIRHLVWIEIPTH